VPRRRSQAVGSSSVLPVELLDVDHLTWASPRLTAQWLERHDLSTAGQYSYEPLSAVSNATRYVVAAGRWVVAQGHFRTYGDSSLPHPDFLPFVELGLPIRVAQERVSVEWLEMVTIA
jgi:hypothetical protein